MLFKMNPMAAKPVLDVSIKDLPATEGEHKVRYIFVLPDGNLLMVVTDKIGAFDQPHETPDGLPAHYPGKGMIITVLDQIGKRYAREIMPTDYLPMDPYLPHIPEQYWSRSSVHLVAERQIKAECIVRSSGEGSAEESARKGKLVCGQLLPEGLLLGEMLSRPYFTPSTKAPKGEKDVNLTLEEYYVHIGDEDLANYLMGDVGAAPYA